ncbi:glycosyltransferase family 22 protein [Sporormia fimetaria CBS 119925]|uniref:Mannosyltransferase n=1 Tax=Sporormia fimetaria CBS 119925 TaxID=1340428 RepID=A0A6A6V8K5_9PLEO|nr:glycosyltransferase family 22 protein [Sporormia fimetaria CBS 119925]
MQNARSGDSTSRSTLAFCAFALANIVAALYSPIQDCDEVFNYWEPTHYLSHGYGFQTWEYSPEYAIRSWAYTGLHAAIIQLGRMLPFASKATEFYFLRIVLSLFCAVCETRFFNAITRALHPRVAVCFLMIMISSPGMYHAAPSYLPSSFAMYTAMLGFSAFMESRPGVGTARGIFWFACGCLLGWPFAGALVLPFVLENIVSVLISRKVIPVASSSIRGAVLSLMLLASQVAIDSYLYRTLVCVPWNIVMYNVFSGDRKGPNIYGVEPWHFYLRNLSLNFTAWLPLALVALPSLVLQRLFGSKPVLGQAFSRCLVYLTPFYLWLAIFTLQPHKEERFMYPAYPALALNAAVALHIVLGALGSSNPKSLISKIPTQLRLAIVLVFVMATLNLGALRTMGVMTAYSAPLAVYAPLEQHALTVGGTICLGKEWYRFPSSYFIPNEARAKFVKSEFTGLLPGEFAEADGLGQFAATWQIPSGMNDENREDPSKYTNIEDCTYLVDSRSKNTKPSRLEPDYIADDNEWETLSCKPFLDPDTSLLGRLIWIPDLPFVPDRYRRKWGEYCLLRRRRDTADEKW